MIIRQPQSFISQPHIEYRKYLVCRGYHMKQVLGGSEAIERQRYALKAKELFG
jgi:hypothetical protein